MDEQVDADLVATFCAITAAAEAAAVHYLSGTDGDLERALNHFFNADAPPPPPPPPAPPHANHLPPGAEHADPVPPPEVFERPLFDPVGSQHAGPLTAAAPDAAVAPQQRAAMRDALYESLIELRDRLAKELNVPLSRVLSPSQITKLCATLDTDGFGADVNDLQAILPAEKCVEVGAEVLATYRAYRASVPQLSDVPPSVSKADRVAIQAICPSARPLVLHSAMARFAAGRIRQVGSKSTREGSERDTAEALQGGNSSVSEATTALTSAGESDSVDASATQESLPPNDYGVPPPLPNADLPDMSWAEAEEKASLAATQLKNEKKPVPAPPVREYVMIDSEEDDAAPSPASPAAPTTQQAKQPPQNPEGLAPIFRPNHKPRVAPAEPKIKTGYKGGPANQIKPSGRLPYVQSNGSTTCAPKVLLTEIATARNALLRKEAQRTCSAWAEQNHKKVTKLKTFDNVPLCFSYTGTDMNDAKFKPQFDGSVDDQAIILAALLRHFCPSCKDLPMSDRVLEAYEAVALGLTYDAGTASKMDAGFIFRGFNRLNIMRMLCFYFNEGRAEFDDRLSLWDQWERYRGFRQEFEEKLHARYPPCRCTCGGFHRDLYTFIDSAAYVSNSLFEPFPMALDCRFIHSQGRMSANITLSASPIRGTSDLTSVYHQPFATAKRTAIKAFMCLVQRQALTDDFPADAPLSMANFPSISNKAINDIHEVTAKCKTHADLLQECALKPDGVNWLPKADTPDGIKLPLKEHQREGVQFMIDREADGTINRIFVDTVTPSLETYRISYCQLTARVDILRRVRVPEGDDELPRVIRGGILADVMGLGKTLQVIALMAARPAAEDWVRLHENPTPQNPLHIKATLIVAPVSICMQWIGEFEKCMPSAKVLLFHGTDRGKYTIADIAAADAVLTTYETIEADLKRDYGGDRCATLMEQLRCKYTPESLKAANAVFCAGPLKSRTVYDSLRGRYVDVQEGSPDYPTDLPEFTYKNVDAYSVETPGTENLRAFLSQMVTSSSSAKPTARNLSMGSIVFHRIVLDECQKCANGSFTNLLKLKAVHRWVVTGTPVNNKYEALGPLFAFLGMPFGADTFKVDSNSTKNCSRLAGLENGAFPRVKAWRSTFYRPDANGEPAGLPFDSQLIQMLPSAVVSRRHVPQCENPPKWHIAYLLMRYMIRHYHTDEVNAEIDLPPMTHEAHIIDQTAEERECYQKIYTRVSEDVQTLARQGRLNERVSRMLMWAEQVRRAAVHPSILAADALAANTANYNDSAGTTNENDRVAIKQVSPAELQTTIDKMNPPPSDACKEAVKGLNEIPPVIEDCAVCMSQMIDPTMLHCTHFLCRECVLGILKAKPECPHCRAKRIDEKQKYQVVFSAEATAAVGGETPEYWSSLIARSDNSSKMAEVLNIIGRGTEDDKYVIFSTFPAFMMKMLKVLKENRIRTEVIDGSTTLQQRGRIIENFQSGGTERGLRPNERQLGPLRVLIISSRCGNAGLTLTAANHLILMEPSLNTVVEVQAMGRIHRLGQTRPVKIHRLVARGTIEEKIYNLSVAGRLVSQGNSGGAMARKSDKNTSSAAVKQLLSFFE